MRRRHLLTFALAGLALPAAAAVSTSSLVLAARGWQERDKLRLVLDLSAATTYQTFTLESPPRLILDLTNTRLGSALDDRSLLQTPVAAIRTSVRPGGSTRIVLEFAEPVESSCFQLPPADGKGNRLVIDLRREARPQLASEAAAGGSLQLANPAERPTHSTHGQRDVLVVIDAGHGGKDPGAVGANGEQEKHVALAIAQQLASRLNRTRGFRARLVRNDDIFIPLRKRPEVARKYGADMFISVHADAAPRRTASGASVFALSENGATSTMARWMADRENNADGAYSTQLLSLKDKDPMIAQVVLDMSLSATISSSLNLGKQVLGTLGSVAGVHGERVEQAGFAVLKSPDIPSILVETGFMSNSEDCKRLVDTRHQAKVANAILAGIGSYFGTNPPPGTYLAQIREGGLA